MSKMVDAFDIRREAVAKIDEVSRDAAVGASDAFNRVVAVAIVLTTLAAAGVEWVRSNAEDEEGKASRSAQVLAVTASAQQWRDTQNANVDFASYGLTSEYRALEYWAVQKYIFADKANSASLLKELDRYTMLADKASGYANFSPGSYGPDADPRYPTEFYAERQTQADAIAAQQNAANDHRAEWANQVAGYTAMLAVLAVAVYLLGLSLSLRVRIRVQLAALGVGLFLFSSIWAGVSQFGAPAERAGADLEAAQAYAAGMQAMRTAYLHEGASGYTDAIRQFKKAIELRAKFARAYYELGLAEFSEGSPQRDSDYVSVTDYAHLQRSTADFRKAFDLGLADALPDLAFNEYLLALPGGGRPQNSGLLDQSIADTRMAINVDPHEPAIYYNLAVALLAAGRQDANEAYKRAVKHTPKDDEGVVGGAITDLGILADRRPDLSGRVLETKQLIIAGVWPANAVEPPPGGMHIKAFYRYSSGLQVQFDLPGFDPKSSAINFQFYHQNADGSSWAVLPQISGPATVLPDSTGGPDSYYLFANYLNQASTCLPAGNFRVEVYLSSQLSGSAVQRDGPAQDVFRNLQYTSFRDIRLRICRPSDWQPADIGADLGFIKGYTSSGRGSDSSCSTAKSCGVYLVRYQFPSIQATDSGLFSDVTAVFLSEEKLFPTKLASESPSGSLGDHWFIGMEPGYTDEWYEYDGGDVLVTAGMLPDQSMVVGVVYGPPSFFTSSRAYRIYESISNID